MIMNKIKKNGTGMQSMSGISAHLLEAYVLWQNSVKHIPKMLRHSIGVKIDTLFARMVELTYIATFASLDKRLPFVSEANTKNDLLKFMLYTLLELKGIKQEAFNELSQKMEEVGKRLYGWKNQIIEQIKKESSNGSTGKPVEPLAKDRK